MPHARLLCSWVALVAALSPAPGRATGIHRFEASGGAHGYVVTPAPEVLGHLEPAAWVLGSYARDPLVLRDRRGAVVRRVVEHHASVELAASIGLLDLFEVGIAVPGVLVGGAGLDGQGLSALSLADPRLMAKLKLTPWREGWLAALHVDAGLPLAQLLRPPPSLIGEPYPSLGTGLAVGYGGRGWRAGVDVGYLLREPTKLGRQTLGHELFWGLGGEAGLWPGWLSATADVYGRLAHPSLRSSMAQAPVEGALGLKVTLGPVGLTAGVGAGLWPGYGTPSARLFGGVSFVPPRPAPAREVRPLVDLPAPAPSPPPPPPAPLPPPDADGDGAPDDDDDCPHDPETRNAHEDEDGCPDALDPEEVVVAVKRDTIELGETVFFRLESDRLLPRARRVLRRVAQVLDEHREIEVVLIEGHTDSTGPDRYNRRLSHWRALAVRRFLIQQGVAPERLKVRALADTRPSRSNRTARGRARNRRVEMHILQGDDVDEPAAPEGSP